MAQEVRLQGRTYSDVPSILLPDSNNVFHPFTDVSDTTATASDVATGKYFYLADGTKTQGTSSGGGGRGSVTQDQDGYLVLDDDAPAPSITVESLSVTQNGTYTAPTGKAYSPVTVSVSGGGGGSWTRPADWPDLSQMDVSSGDILYMTSFADEDRGFCAFSVTCTGQYTVEVGTITGSTFTAESTQSINSNSNCRIYYGSAAGTYKVLRVTGTSITKLIFNSSAAITIDNFNGWSNNQGIIDIVGKLPSCTNLLCKEMRNLVNVEIDSVAPSTMASMFSSCFSLASVDVSGWDTSAVTSMSQVFYSCYSLTTLDMSGLDTSAVTSMRGMFINCYSLVSVDVSDWDMGVVENISQMFYNCTSLTTLDVSGWDTSAVTNMSYLFYYCLTLESLDVSDWDTGLVSNMMSLFGYCQSLISLDVSSWDFSSLTTATNAGSIFGYCYGLRGSLTIPSTMTMIGNSCFNGCRSLYEWHFKATTPPTLNSTNAFSNMTDFGGKKIYVPLASLSAYQTAQTWSTYAAYMVGE